MQPTDGAADGLHQAVGGSNVPVQIAEKGFHPALYHLVCSGAKMHGRYLLDALPLKGAQVNTFWSASRFQIAVGDGLPAMPPNFGIFLIVPVHRVFLVTLPVPGREPDALTVFVKVVYLSGFRELLAVFVHCPERQQNVGVWVSIFLVVDGKVSDHSFVIFITENDVIKAGLPIYHVDRTVRETGTVFNDQAHIVYVNSQIKDETALGKLMHDFFCTNSKDMNYSILAQRVRYFKEDTKGVAAMCRAMEKMRDETEHETSVKHALAMLADGVPCEKVAKYTDLSIEEVRALAEKKSA